MLGDMSTARVFAAVDAACSRMRRQIEVRTKRRENWPVSVSITDGWNCERCRRFSAYPQQESPIYDFEPSGPIVCKACATFLLKDSRPTRLWWLNWDIKRLAFKKKKMRKQVATIKLDFPDGVYSFWLLRKPGTEKRFIVRSKESAKRGTGKPWTVKERHSNLIREISETFPDLAISVKAYTKFTPAALPQVVDWLVSHRHDLYDLVEQWQE